MKRSVAVLLLLTLVASFGAGLFYSLVQAGSCSTFCEVCSCRIHRCCNGVCTDLGPCQIDCSKFQLPCPE